MAVKIEIVRQDLLALVENCNTMAHEFSEIDPLLELSFSLKVEDEMDDFKASVVIDRNSGGSPESNYAIQDEIAIQLSADGHLLLIFNREMTEEDRVDQTLETPSQWKEILDRVYAFCHWNLPKPIF